MTDEAYAAKQWLRRIHYLALRVEASERTLEVLQNRIDGGVAKYENTGATVDRDQARKKHEDQMLDYVEQSEKLSKERHKLNREIVKTRKVIKKIGDPELEAIATNRYIFRLNWSDVVKISHFSRAQVFRYHLKMLDKVAAILNNEKEKKNEK